MFFYKRGVLFKKIGHTRIMKKDKSKNKTKSKKKSCSDEIVKLYKAKSKEDPFGSYTGVPIDGGEPVQDVDDL